MSTTLPESEIPSSNPLFRDFFELGHLENASPFLESSTRHWGSNLTLKASLLAAILLCFSFAFSFYSSLIPFSHLLLVIVYFLAGIPALIESIEDLSDGEINIDILMTLAAFSSIFIGSGMEGALLLVLFALSGAMEDAVTNKAKGALSSLHKLTPSKATIVKKDGTHIERSIKDIQVGAIILVKAGQTVPLDGKVIEGSSSINLVHLTGENLPVTKVVGDEVPSGGQNLEGAITLEVIRTSSDSTVARIIQLVTQAQEAKPALQRWFDKISRGYAITIIGLSIFFALSFPFLFSLPFLGTEGSVYRAIAFLIAASPCALIIAIPIAYLSAVSTCAKHGILLKGGITLDALAKCQAMAFDKTGTLTSGKLRCLSIETIKTNEKISLDTALAVAYALEKNAIHPIATAISAYALEKQVELIFLSQFKSIPGFGLEAEMVLTNEKQKICIGRPNYIAAKLSEASREQLLTRIKVIETTGDLITVLIIGSTPFIFRFSDEPRPLVKEMLLSLKQQGIKSVMLTGDHYASAKSIANQLGIDTFYAELTPEDKLRHVTELSRNEGLAMVGDGVNDAPALARATVGIGMGKVGSTAATEAADVVLLHDNIELLDWLFKKAKQTQVIVRQNLIIAIGAIFIASIPALGGLVPLWLAVVMHEGGTVLVGLNALRLLRA